MTFIPPNFNRASAKQNLARAIVALTSVVAPAIATEPVYGTPTGTPPVKPVEIAATSSNPGIKGCFQSFGLAPTAEDPLKTFFWMELPYSVKVFALTLDKRKSLLSLGRSTPIVKALVATETLASVATLEQYAYDQAINLPGVKSKMSVDPLTGRTFIYISGVIDNSIDQLLSDSPIGRPGNVL